MKAPPKNGGNVQWESILLFEHDVVAAGSACAKSAIPCQGKYPRGKNRIEPQLCRAGACHPTPFGRLAFQSIRDLGVREAAGWRGLIRLQHHAHLCAQGSGYTAKHAQ